MILKTFNDTIEHRGQTLVVRAVRNKCGPRRHWVEVVGKRSRQEFDMGGSFGASLRNRAAEKFVGMET